MKPTLRRVHRLEEQFALRLGKAKVALRMIVTSVCTSDSERKAPTCRRFVCAGGLIEAVYLYGEDTSMTGTELDAFVERFPIEYEHKSESRRRL